MSAAAATLSPCIALCQLGPDNICRGCYRHIDEISGWSLLTETEQRKILVRVDERRQHALPDPLLISEPGSSHD